jgi:hypothetical protein
MPSYEERSDAELIFVSTVYQLTNSLYLYLIDHQILRSGH